jgi:[ribosomal protein S5]-alanine N-acetyltransferase
MGLPTGATMEEGRGFRIPVNDLFHLSEIRSSDAASLIQHLNQSREIYNFTCRIPYPYTEQDAQWFLHHVQEEAMKHGHPINFAIRASTSHQNELIGAVGFVVFDTTTKSAEVGYWLAKPYWGQGIMTCVVKAICAYASTSWNMQQIQGQVYDTNEASARVLEKNGFVFQELLPKYVDKDGVLRDVKVYEWKKQ